jgi:hypothetical protein
MYIVRVFDQLIHNTDRNLANLVVTVRVEPEMIDHTRPFRIFKKLRNPGNLVRCDRELLRRMQRLSEEGCMRELRPYLTKTEVRALLARRDRVIEHFESAVAQRREQTILYSYLAASDN